MPFALCIVYSASSSASKSVQGFKEYFSFHKSFYDNVRKQNDNLRKYVMYVYYKKCKYLCLVLLFALFTYHNMQCSNKFYIRRLGASTKLCNIFHILGSYTYKNFMITLKYSPQSQLLSTARLMCFLWVLTDFRMPIKCSSCSTSSHALPDIYVLTLGHCMPSGIMRPYQVSQK